MFLPNKEACTHGMMPSANMSPLWTHNGDIVDVDSVKTTVARWLIITHGNCVVD